MAILVACKCGKQFKAADQHAGKRTRCPGCGEPLTIPKPARAEEPAEADIFSLGEPEVFQPLQAPAKASAGSAKKSSAAAGVPPLSKSNRKAPAAGVAPRVSVSPGMIALIVLAILIPAGIYWAKVGPMQAYQDWKHVSGVAEDNVVGQITRAIQYHYKMEGFDMTDIKFQPKALNIVIDEPAMMLRLPDSVAIQGRSTGGMWHGTMHPKTWQFEADVPIQGTDHHIEGSFSESDRTLKMDSKPVTD